MGIRARRTALMMLAVGTLSAGARLGAQSETAPVRARISGVVFDSLAQRPLRNATVQLVSIADAARAVSFESGADGAFHFDSVEAGAYLLGFYHPVLDSLGMSSPLTRVDVRVTGELREPLAVPSAQTLLRAFCGEAAVRDSVGALLGYVRSARDGLGVPKSQVRVMWSQISVGARGLERTTPSVEGETSEQGGIALCGLPRGATVTARAWNGRDSTGIAELEIPAHGLVRRDLFIGTMRTVATADSLTDSTLVTQQIRRGAGTLRGVVRRPDGSPLPGARLRFWGSEVATTADGTYRLDSIPTGTHTLDARALGFLPYRQAVDVMDGGESVADLRLEAFTTYLDTVKVTTQRIYASRQMQEFEARRKVGFGYFFDEDAITRRNPFFMSDLFRTVPGVTVARGSGFGDQILMRGMGFRAYCAPAVFVDGARMYNVEGGDLDGMVSAQDVRALEVYTRGSNVPVQFQTLEGCGSIVIWTGGRRPLLSGK